MRAPSAMTSSSPTAAPSATAPAVAAAVSSAIVAAAIVLGRTVVPAPGRIVLCGIVVRRKVLRRGGVRIRLAFVRTFRVRLILRRRLRFAVTFLQVLVFRGLRFILPSVLFIKVMFFCRVGFLPRRLVVLSRGASQ